MVVGSVSALTAVILGSLWVYVSADGLECRSPCSSTATVAGVIFLAGCGVVALLVLWGAVWSVWRLAIRVGIVRHRTR